MSEDNIPMRNIEQLIYTIRGEKVILDSDLAHIYGVQTKALNQAVKRNKDRFPVDFAFQLTAKELDTIDNRSQIVTGSQKHRDPRYLPWAFTEHGAIMAANVLKSPRAVQMSVYVVRAFVRLRRYLATHKELTNKLNELERRLAIHDKQIQDVFDAIRQLMAVPQPNRRRIGFLAKEKALKYGHYV